jgi:hypothetical protein
VIGKSLNSVQLVQLVKGFEEGKHPRTEDGKFTSGVDTNGKREPYNSSTTKAKELKAEDWGTPEEIIEMATMPRTAKNRKEAVEILKTVIDEKNIKSISGVIAYIPKKNIGKIVSRQAIDTSLSEQAHYHAVANIDKLFSNAIEKWQFELNPNKNNEGLKDRKYLYAPMEYKERIIPVKITVKEYKNEEKEKQIYTIEAIDVGIDKNGEECPDHVEDGVITKTIALYTPLNDIPHGVFNLVSFNSPPDTNNLPYLFDDVNVSLVFQSALQSPQGLPATGEGNPHDANIIGKSFKEDEHPRTENGKFTSGTADTNGKREAWDSSTSKAKELKAEDWGTPEEIIEMATMPRTAKNREEAIVILREIARKGPLISKSGIIATLSGKSINEITSGQEKSKSLNAAAHWLAAANIDKLFSNAIEPWKFELDPNKNNENLKDRRYLYAPMRYNNQVIPIRITLKEYKEKESTKRIYSIMAIDIDIKKGQTVLDTNASLIKSQERPSNSPFDSTIIGKNFKEDEHPREENGKFTSSSATNINNGKNESAGQLTFSHDEHSRIVPIADFNKKVFQSTVDGAFGTYFPRTLPSTQVLFNNMHKTGESQVPPEEQALDVVKHLDDFSIVRCRTPKVRGLKHMGVNLQTVLGNLKKSLGLKKSLDDEEQADFEAEAQEDQEDDNPEEEEEEEEIEDKEVISLVKGLLKQNKELLALQKSMGIVLVKLAEQQNSMAKSVLNRRGVISTLETHSSTKEKNDSQIRHKQFTAETKAVAAEVMRKALSAGSLSLEDCVKLESQINQSMRDPGFQLDERYIQILASAARE